MNILVTIPKGLMRDTFMPTDIVERINSMGRVEWNNLDKNWTGEDLKE